MVRRRTLVIVAACLSFLLVATVALAIFYSSKQTATSTFGAASVGTVNIGTAEGTELFTLGDMEPGDSEYACFNAQVFLAGGASQGDWRLYSGAVAGGLADFLWVTIDLGAPSPALLSPGIFNCTGFVRDTTIASNELLSSYGSTTASYAAGDSLGAQFFSGTTTVPIMITVTLPNTPGVEAGASGLTAATSWFVENQ